MKYGNEIFIDGQAGTTGLRIHERLENRSDLELITLPDETRKDSAARQAAIRESDITFLCLPDAAARELWHSPGTRMFVSSTPRLRIEPIRIGHTAFPELSPAHREKIALQNASLCRGAMQAVLHRWSIRWYKMGYSQRSIRCSVSRCPAIAARQEHDRRDRIPRPGAGAV